MTLILWGTGPVFFFLLCATFYGFLTAMWCFPYLLLSVIKTCGTPIFMLSSLGWMSTILPWLMWTLFHQILWGTPSVLMFVLVFFLSQVKVNWSIPHCSTILHLWIYETIICILTQNFSTFVYFFCWFICFRTQFLKSLVAIVLYVSDFLSV